MDEYLGSVPYEYTECTNARNGKKNEINYSKYSEIEIDISQDSESFFELKVVQKRQKNISGMVDKIIVMYAKELTMR